MSSLEVAQSIVSMVGIVLIPLAILLVGQWFTHQREKSDAVDRARRDQSDAEQRDADRMALLLRHLSSDNARERLLAIHVIGHLRDTDRFPKDLMRTMTFVAFSDRPDIAAAAQMAVGIDIEEIPPAVLMSELLAPLKVHLERSYASFSLWRRQDLFLEEIIHDSNLFARDLLTAKSHMIPTDLMSEDSMLVEHYNAWLEEYDRVRPNDVRDPNQPFVFVGIPPINKPFPSEASLKFIARFKEFQETANEQNRRQTQE